VSLTAMCLLVFLFLKLNQNQTELIQLLTASNQSLLNQARTSEVASLAGLNNLTGVETTPETEYMSTEDREMAVWIQQQQVHGIGEGIYEEDFEAMRSDL